MRSDPEIVFENKEHPNAHLYEKECLVCHNKRKFIAGTERDRQSVCGNCWVW